MTDTLPPAGAEQVAAVRALYAAGQPLTEIRAQTGLPLWRVYFWLDNEIGPDGKPRLRPLPRRRANRGPDAGRMRRQKLAERIWRAAEAQVCEIETRMLELSPAPAEAERDARALAVLARVVRELSALERHDPAGKTDAPNAAPADEDARGSRDLDTFRRELARRLDALRGDGTD